MGIFDTKKPDFGLCVAVVSLDENRLEQITQSLSLKGAKSFIKIALDPLSLTKAPNLENAKGVVFDSKSLKDAKEYALIFAKFFPKHLPLVVLSDSDSIVVYQEFLDLGIFYLHFQSQKNLIYDKLLENSTQNEKTQKRSIKIALIGAKGGVGNSYLSYHFAKILQERYKTKTLLIQGATSSFNLDLISAKTFEQKDLSKNLGLLKSAEKLLEINIKEAKDYNFYIYDISCQALAKEEIEHILNETDTSIVVSSLDLSSLRKLKEIIKINEFLNSVNQGSKSFYVCINNIHSPKLSISKMDIELIIERQISSLVDFQKISFSKPGFEILPSAKHSLELLLDKITNTKSAELGLIKRLKNLL